MIALRRLAALACLAVLLAAAVLPGGGPVLAAVLVDGPALAGPAVAAAAADAFRAALRDGSRVLRPGRAPPAA